MCVRVPTSCNVHKWNDFTTFIPTIHSTPQWCAVPLLSLPRKVTSFIDDPIMCDTFFFLFWMNEVFGHNWTTANLFVQDGQLCLSCIIFIFQHWVLGVTRMACSCNSRAVRLNNSSAVRIRFVVDTRYTHCSSGSLDLRANNNNYDRQWRGN